MSLVVPHNIQKYNLHYQDGYDKKYPNLDLVRLEGWYFKRRLGTVLDYGCGTGTNMLHLLECGYTVIGVDAAERSIELVKSKLAIRSDLQERASLRLIGLADTKLPLDTQSCDYVVCMSVLSLLESRDRISQLIAEFHRVLKPEGKMIVDINGPEGDFAAKGRFVSDDTFEYFLKPGHKEPLRCYCPKTKETFAELLNAFAIEDIGYVSFEYLGHRSFEFLACVRKPSS